MHGPVLSVGVASDCGADPPDQERSSDRLACISYRDRARSLRGRFRRRGAGVERSDRIVTLAALGKTSASEFPRVLLGNKPSRIAVPERRDRAALVCSP